MKLGSRSIESHEINLFKVKRSREHKCVGNDEINVEMHSDQFVSFIIFKLFELIAVKLTEICGHCFDIFWFALPWATFLAWRLW